jgi:uncharacterized protein YqiB (DUF1249 family)
MSRTVRTRCAHPETEPFGWLMGLYAENHVRLVRLFAPATLRSARTSPASATDWT